MSDVVLDAMDFKMLEILHANAATTNHEIGEQIGLSSSQVSRRRARLEEVGIIKGYRALLNTAALGLSMTVFISVTPVKNARIAKKLKDLISDIPYILDAYTMSDRGEILLKVVVPEAVALSTLVTQVLLPHEAISEVRCNLVLETLKDDGLLPLVE